MGQRLTIWTKDGREVVCVPLDHDHPLRTSREGFRCKVMTTDGERGHSHVYYDRKPFQQGNKVGSATIFYQRNAWWISFVPLKGWNFSFTPPSCFSVRAGKSRTRGENRRD